MLSNCLLVHRCRIPSASERDATGPTCDRGYAETMSDEPYADRGLSASQLGAQLTAEAEVLSGEVVAVAFPGRGGVLWQPGEVRLVGPVRAEFELAIDALLDGTDLGSGTQMRDALLSMGGARLVVDRVPRRLVDGRRLS
jgi:hypothetical protein